MTILQKLLRRGDGHVARGWHRFRHGDQAVRYTEAWEHETFAEEQARWERSDPEYARICEQVRQAKGRGEEAWRRADEAKAEWDARAATQAARLPFRGPATRNPVSNEPNKLEVE